MLSTAPGQGFNCCQRIASAMAVLHAMQSSALSLLPSRHRLASASADKSCSAVEHSSYVPQVMLPVSTAILALPSDHHILPARPSMSWERCSMSPNSACQGTQSWVIECRHHMPPVRTSMSWMRCSMSPNSACSSRVRLHR